MNNITESMKSIDQLIKARGSGNKTHDHEKNDQIIGLHLHRIVT